MNGYFWLFALCALLATPVTAHVQLRIGRGVHYRLRLQAAGLPFLRKKEAESNEGEKTLHSRQMAKGLFAADGRMLYSLFRGGHLKRTLKAFHLQSVWVHIRLSFADAAQTALCYAALRTILQTVLSCHSSADILRGRVEADFQSQGTEIFLRCILSTRLGILTAALIRTGAAMIRLRVKTRTEERYDAQASH